MVESNIKWKNIYHMICYCVEELDYFEDADITYEDVKGSHDLLAKLLINAFNKICKFGYLERYIKTEIITDKPYGNIDIPKSIALGVYGTGKAVCIVDRLNIDVLPNQILKAVFKILIDSDNYLDNKINRNLMDELKYCESKLNKVTDIHVDKNIFKGLIVEEYYRPAMIVSRFIVDEYLYSDSSGIYNSLELNDNNRLCIIWEKFLRRYIREYINKSDKYNEHYIIEKITYEYGGEHKTPDIVIMSNKTDYILVADAKWYESESTTPTNTNQVLTHGNMLKHYNRDKKVSSISLYISSNRKTSMIRTYTQYKGDKNAENFKADHFINVNQDFDKIKQSINEVVDRYLTYENSPFEQDKDI